MKDITERCDDYIQYAESVKKFQDLDFYNTAKAEITRLRTRLAKIEGQEPVVQEPLRFIDGCSDGDAWRDVVGYEGLYLVSRTGDIKRAKTSRLQSKSLMGSGYVKADLWKNSKRKQTSVHRVVAEAFIGPVKDLEVNHINGVKTDNRVENLEICTRSFNEQHSRSILGNLCKPVIAISDITGETIRYASIESAARSGFCSSSIYACCYKKQGSHNGWSFIFEDECAAPVPATPTRSRLVRDGTPSVYISKELPACTHRMSESDIPVWCQSGDDVLALLDILDNKLSPVPAIPEGWQIVPLSVIAFLHEVKDQIPEKPDYWSSCSQCQSNSNDADDLLDAIAAAPQPEGEAK